MKFQDSSFNGLKVTVGTKSVTHPRTHAPTNGRSKSNMPHQLFQSWGHKYKLHYGRCTEPLFRAATPAAVTTNKNINMSSFKSSENIQKKEVIRSKTLCFDSRLLKVFFVILMQYIAFYGSNDIHFHENEEQIVWGFL